MAGIMSVPRSTQRMSTVVRDSGNAKTIIMRNGEISGMLELSV